MFGTLTEEEHLQFLKSQGKLPEVEESSSIKPRESLASQRVNEIMRTIMTSYVDEVCMYAARTEEV